VTPGPASVPPPESSPAAAPTSAAPGDPGTTADVSTARTAADVDDGGSGGILGPVIGVGLIALLGGLAFWTARRRARSDS